MAENTTKITLQITAMGLSLAVAVLMLVGKLTAYYISGSTAILSDAAESVIHLFATGIAAFSLWYSRQPSDPNHPYGHGKIAYFSAGFEGALILTAACYIIYASIQDLIVGPELRNLGMGLAITAALAAVNLALGAFLVMVGNTHNAFVLVANGKHVLTDMWTSAAVVAGVGLVLLTGIVWLDPVVALLAGLNILASAVRLMRKSFAGLLDEADPKSTQQILECLQRATSEGLLSGFHQLRHRNADDIVWIEVHMLVPNKLSVQEAHSRVTTVEDRIDALFPKHTVHVTSHIEPQAHHRAHPEGHPLLNDPFEQDSVPNPKEYSKKQ